MVKKKTVSADQKQTENEQPATKAKVDFSKLNPLSRLKKDKSKKVVQERGYFRGAWYELRQVRWPDRRASLSLTLAVILFSLGFAAIILGLDYIFQIIFRKVLL